MSYEWAMPLHITGMAMTVTSNFLLPAGIPLSVEMFITLSNPGMIDAAGEHWKNAAKTAAELKTDLEKAKKLDPEFWTGDDQKAFAHEVDNYINQLDALISGINGIGEVLGYVAIAFMILCCLVLTVGLIMLALFLICLAALPIPIIGEAIIADLNATVGGIVGAIIPSFASLKEIAATVAAFIGYVWATQGGIVQFKRFTAKGTAPDFTQVQTPALGNAPS